MNRHELRERLLQALYAQHLSEDSISHIRETLLHDFEEETPEYSYAARLLNKIVDENSEIPSLIEKHTKNWDLNRIAVIDLLLIKMGIAEFLFFDDIPPKVTINEMIDIAKDFSTDNSGKFVNGILDAVYLDLKQSHRISKQGRGLIDS